MYSRRSTFLLVRYWAAFHFEVYSLRFGKLEVAGSTVLPLSTKACAQSLFCWQLYQFFE